LKGDHWYGFGDEFKAHLKFPKTLQESSVRLGSNLDMFEPSTSYTRAYNFSTTPKYRESMSRNKKHYK